jgi:hypothetical protein
LSGPFSRRPGINDLEGPRLGAVEALKTGAPKTRGKLAKADTHLREALKLNSAGPTGHDDLGVALLKRKRFSEAQEELELANANGGARDASCRHCISFDVANMEGKSACVLEYF